MNSAQNNFCILNESNPVLENGQDTEVSETISILLGIDSEQQPNIEEKQSEDRYTQNEGHVTEETETAEIVFCNQEGRTKITANLCLVPFTEIQTSEMNHQPSQNDDDCSTPINEQSEEIKVRESKPHKCPECDRIYSSHWNMRRHHKNVHAKSLIDGKEEETTSLIRDSQIEEERKELTLTGDFICRICAQSFPSKNALTSHIGWHSRQVDKIVVKSEELENSGTQNETLSTTEQIIHASEFQNLKRKRCTSQGDTNFGTAKKQKANTDRPGKDRTEECPMCFKTLSTRFNLKRHLRTHEKKGEEKVPFFTVGNQAEEIFKCYICGQPFTSKSVLASHICRHLRKEDPVLQGGSHVERFYRRLAWIYTEVLCTSFTDLQ
ncbi:hypothetical protein WA026_017528 [Henosepilachna vigintioctopunctata]|uniref:C2H2-type domain-containing protein n=1 Tax=Henosepilachna vigintioctopunctata TaxID=420089 RepID=A0AAW1V3D9_9CUCU